ncbi:retrotransposon protein, putative, ty1-copia subclass [Tanacetum coccineum]
MEVKHELSNEMCASTPEEVAYMKKVPYASAVGSIMYAVRCTRPDVAFAQNLVSRYQQNPGKLYWVAVKHIMKYLRNTKDMLLVYGGKPDAELNVTGFSVVWKSKKQTTIAMSATQAEYMAALEAAMEAVWIRKFVGDLGVMPSIKEPINMYCDNSAAIIFAKDSRIMKGARHFLRKYHFALPRGKVTDLANGIGLQLASSFMHTYDILITCQDKFSINELKDQLHQTFSIKDLRALNYYLGIEFLRNSTGLAMSQRKFTLDLLILANVMDSKPCTTPLKPNTKLNLTDGTLLPEPKLYRTLVGKLIYLTINRPNISFAAQTQSRFLKEPRTPHMTTLTRVLWYLKLCLGQGLFFSTFNNLNHGC